MQISEAESVVMNVLWNRHPLAADDVVGAVGATGRVTGAHLHWALRVGTARVDALGALALLPRVGNVRSTGKETATLWISEQGTVEGSVDVPAVVINGTVIGDVHARCCTVCGTRPEQHCWCSQNVYDSGVSHTPPPHSASALAQLVSPKVWPRASPLHQACFRCTPKHPRARQSPQTALHVSS